MAIINAMSRQALAAALTDADLRVLLMVMFQISGDERWLRDPYLPRRDVRLIAAEDAGFSPRVQDDIRNAALEMLTRPAGVVAIPCPDEPTLLRMMRACLAEEVAPEYAPMMAEQMGFSDLLEGLPELTATLPQKPLPEQPWPVLIAGAGVSGIALGRLLLEARIPFLILDKNAEVGGTWWQNRYPGCGVDTPNHAYSFSFGPAFAWSSFFSPRADIQAYLEQTAAAADLYPHIRFGSEIQSASWDEARGCWLLEVASPEGSTMLSCRALISAVGQLNLPALPDIPGLDSFAGPAFHSSAWPDALELAGKRVAVIGTGASAMQIVPTIAPEVAELTIYQRTPQWARPIPRYHETISDGARILLEQVPFYAPWLRFSMFWRYGDGLLPFLRRDPQWPHPERAMNRINDRHRQEMLAHIEQTLAGREDLLARCVPAYPPYGKRILLDNGWFDTLLRPNVELVSEAVAGVDAHGITDASGSFRACDVIVLATGFQVGKMAARLNISGREGRDLASDWQGDNPTAHLGISIAGYPNLFCMMGPSTGLGHGGSAMFQAEVQARYIVAALLTLFNDELHSLEVRPEVQQDFVERVDAEHSELIWSHPQLQTYYRNAQGRVFSLLPWRIVDYWNMTRRFQREEYRARQTPAAPG